MLKNILITGAGSGIGKDAAFALATKGHKVIAAIHTEEQISLVQKELKLKKISLEIIKLDITINEDREKILKYDLDILINNAGIGESGSLAEIPVDLIKKNFEVNVFSTIALTQLALKKMIERDKGTILFISSLAGRIPMPFLGPYSMTKYALSGGVAALRNELKLISKNINISLIEPGSYHTGFNQVMLAKNISGWTRDRSSLNIFQKSKQQKKDNLIFLERKDTKDLIKEIIEACESQRTKLRYSAPFYQFIFVQIMRILGK